MEISNLITQVVIIIILIIVGLIATKAGILRREIKKDIADILLYISIPAATVNAFNSPIPMETLKRGAVVFIFGFVSHIVAVIASHFMFKKEKQGTKEVMSFVAVFSNCAFMGYPIMQSILGEIGVFYASLYFISFNIFMWTYGHMIYTKKTDAASIKKALFNMGTYSVLIGVILIFSPIKIPYMGSQVLSILGSLTTPLAMLIVGTSLADVQLKSLFSGKHMYIATALRLLLIPLFWMLVLKLMGLDETVIIACTLLVAMPAASTTVIFAEKFDGHAALASQVVVLSTLLCIFTIPFMIMVI